MYRPALTYIVKHFRGTIVGLVLFVIVTFLSGGVVIAQSAKQTLTYAQFYRAVAAGQVADVTIREQRITGVLRSGPALWRSFMTTIGNASDVLPALRSHHVNVTIGSKRDTPLEWRVFEYLQIGVAEVTVLVAALEGRKVRLQRLRRR